MPAGDVRPRDMDQWMRWVEQQLRVRRSRSSTPGMVDTTLAMLGEGQVIDGGTGAPARDTIYSDPDSTAAPVIPSNIPPQTPSAPTATARLGVVNVCWDGLSVNDDAMAVGVSAELHRSQEGPDFAPTDETFYSFIQPAGCVPVTGQEYESVWYYRLVAVNRIGLRSSPSPSVSASTTPLVNADVIGEIIAGANIIDGSINAADKVIANSVTTALLAALAVTADKLAANSVTADKVAAGSITAEKLAALLVLASKMASAESGRRWEADQYGIRLYDSDETLLINLPTDPSTAATFRGDVVASSLTLLDQLALRGTTNEVSKGGVLTLASGVTAPSSPPTVSLSNDWLHFEDAPTFSQYALSLRGLVRDGSYYYSALLQSDDRVHLLRWDATTGARDTTWDILVSPLSASGVEPDGVTVLGGNIYVLGWNSAANEYRVVGYSIATKAQVQNWVWSAFSTWGVALGNNGTDLLIAGYRDGTGRVEAIPYSVSGVQGTPMVTDVTHQDRVTGVAYGTFDYGANRLVLSYEGYWVGANPNNARVTALSGGTWTEQVNERWPLTVVTFGMAWDATLGQFVDLNGAIIRKYTAIKWTTESDQWWASNTWYDSDATGGTHETQQGPRTKFTMLKRRKITISSPPLPARPSPTTTDDVVAAGFYLGRGATDPGRLNMNRHTSAGAGAGYPADGVTTINLTSATVGVGTNVPPLSNNFPNTAPGQISSSDPARFAVKGDGSGVWGSITTDTSGVSRVTKAAKIETPLLLVASSTLQSYSANVSTLITWPSASINDDGWTLDGTSVYWTCPRNGTYDIFLQASLSTGPSGTNWAWLMIYADSKDGELHTHGFLPPNTNSAEFEAFLPGVRMEVGDRFWCYTRSNIANGLTAKSVRAIRTGGE